MRIILFVAISFFLSLNLFGQYSIKGKVIDNASDQPLPGASVFIEFLYQGSYTGLDGQFSIENIKPDLYVVQVTYIGYEVYTLKLDLKSDTFLNIVLPRRNVLTDEVIVAATRTNAKSPIANEQIKKETIDEMNLAQDVPYMLRYTPSTVVTSDAGAGVGYTGIRIRGSDATRVNVTINGIPLNDAESQGVFWVNMPDLLASTDNIEIQRGVGTSTHGAGAFGGSISMQTTGLNQYPYGTLSSTYGSFNTLKNSVGFGTGLINEKFTIDGRFSKITSDGYIDRASSDLKSMFLSAGYYGKKDILKFNIISGKEITYQSWWGTPEAKLENDAVGIEAVIANNFYSPEQAENLRNSGRTFNYYLYENEVDNYQQDHYQLIYSHSFNNYWSANGALHYTYGRGYFEQYRPQDDLADYGLDPVTVGSDTITNSDIIRRRWLDNDYYGFTYSANYNNQKRINVTLGGAWNQYLGAHFGEIIWAEYASNSEIYDRYYENDAIKTDFNTFLKADYLLSDDLSAYIDLQYRNVGYSFLGFDNNLNNVQQTDQLNFFNPKIGFNYGTPNKYRVYGYYGIGNKEPNRNDYTESTPQSRPKHETLHNIEVGAERLLNNFSILGNIYYMNYKNQLVLTGQVNDVGAYTRQNIDQSYRAGLELVAGYRVSKQLEVSGNATLSQNKIKNFKAFVDNYDDFSQEEIIYTNTDIAFSPSVIGAGVVTYKPIKNVALTWQSKYVGKQFLDNTSDESKTLDAYWLNNARLDYALKNKLFKELNVSLQINNVFNLEYASNGYTFAYIAGGETISENYLYPQAGTNFLLNLTLNF